MFTREIFIKWLFILHLFLYSFTKFFKYSANFLNSTYYNYKLHKISIDIFSYLNPFLRYSLHLILAFVVFLYFLLIFAVMSTPFTFSWHSKQRTSQKLTHNATMCGSSNGKYSKRSLASPAIRQLQTTIRVPRESITATSIVITKN